MDRPDPRECSTGSDVSLPMAASLLVFIVMALLIGSFLMFWPEVWAIARYLATGHVDAHSSDLIRYSARGRANDAAVELMLLLIGLAEWIGLAYWLAERYA